MNARGVTSCAGLLFDLDGTLAQTEHLHHAAFSAVLAESGRSLDHPTFLRYVLGRSNDDITAFLFPDKDGDERVRLAGEKERWFRELALAGVDATPGAYELIEWARAHDIVTGLVTNAPRENAELLIAVLRLERSFDLVVSAVETGRSKPHPDPYLAALSGLSLDASRSVAIEDSVTGIAAARAARLAVIAIANVATAHSLEGSGATLTVDDMTDRRIYDLLESRLGASKA